MSEDILLLYTLDLIAGNYNWPKLSMVVSFVAGFFVFGISADA